MWSIICSWAKVISSLVGLSGGGEVMTYGVLPALLVGDEEREGTKMGKDKRDIVGQLCGV